MKKEPVYEQKLYCPQCKNVYQYRTNECEVCGFAIHNHFWVDERFKELRSFRAIRSMEKYMENMRNE
ncbi:hypothetical protein SEPL_050 [Salmonella phage SE_PL]|nr:hypothetical protein 7t3_0558 [Salmonella phage 7t3]QIG62663.1 hypothetical protein SEPL_050 [Salmonella phage SE_PL]WNV47484.1 hypothetical protein [Klebsiella phage fENko-Kae01]